jgi:hyperosmotically inducible protein
MKPITLATCLVLSAFVAPVVSYADTDSDRSHPGSFVKDSVITTKVKAKLADEKMSSLVRITVDTDDRGAVVLGGKVKTQHEADRAISIARNTEGVTSVTSTIRVEKDNY